MKSCVCCIVKNENLYLRDWIEYYYNIGFDNIILYDNNDIEGEYPQQVIGDYISNGYVIYKDVRGKKRYQLESYGECFKEYSGLYDWMAFFDCDEFIEIPYDTKINDFFNRDCFKESCDAIILYWLIYGDNGLVHYDSRPVYNRFTTTIGPYKESNNYKLIIRCNTNKFDNVKFIDANMITYTIYYDDFFIKTSDGNLLKESQWTSFTLGNGYLKHYNTYTIEEFLYRRFGRRGYADKDSSFNKETIMNIFYSINEMTEEKEKIIEDFFNKFEFIEDNV